MFHGQFLNTNIAKRQRFADRFWKTKYKIANMWLRKLLGFILLSQCLPPLAHPKSIMEMLLFFPTARDESQLTPIDLGYPFEDVYFKNANGDMLNGWWIPSKTDRPMATIVHSHGNGKNMSSHLKQSVWLCDFGYNVLMYDYRGYGNSEGKPSINGLYQDVITAFDYVDARNEQNLPLISFGQSLGGITSYRSIGDWAGSDKIKFIVLDATFFSYRKMASAKIGPLAWLILGKWHDFFNINEQLSKPAMKDTPLLLLHGTKDKIVPVRMSDQMNEYSAHERSFYWRFPKLQHMQTLKADTTHPETGNPSRQELLKLFDQYL